jgi:hypothetical protein
MRYTQNKHCSITADMFGRRLHGIEGLFEIGSALHFANILQSNYSKVKEIKKSPRNGEIMYEAAGAL